MSPHRAAREQKALAYLRQRGRASAFEIGAAAVHGERWANNKLWHAKEAIGLSIAVALARDGTVRPTRRNEFEIVETA